MKEGEKGSSPGERRWEGHLRQKEQQRSRQDLGNVLVLLGEQWGRGRQPQLKGQLGTFCVSGLQAHRGASIGPFGEFQAVH